MATRRVLNELIARYQETSGRAVSMLAVGGIDAGKRVRAGEVFDVVALAADVIAKLETEGFIRAGSGVGFVRSPMAFAVREGAAKPDISDEAAVKAALLGARSIGYSTGPSGSHLLHVLKSWGLDPATEPARFVQAKAGVPVAALVAKGEAEIGVQQLSEFLSEAGIEIVGLPPAPIQSVTTFSLGVGARAANVQGAEALIAYLNAPETVETKRKHGMEPA